MGLDRTRWAEVLVGLDRVRVLEVARDSGDRVHVAVESTDTVAGCSGCGTTEPVKDFETRAG